MRHHRHIRGPAPRPKSRQRLLLATLGVGIGIVALVGAYAVGSFILGSFASVPSQSSAVGIPNAPPGVSFVFAEAQLVNHSTAPAAGACTALNLGNASSPTALTNGTVTPICLSSSVGGFASADTMYTLEIGWNATALNSTVFKVQVTIDVTPSANDITVTSYVKTSAKIVSSDWAVYAVDLTQAGDTSVVQFGVLVTEL